MGEMRIFGSEGDLKVIWDPENEDEVEAARTQFDDLKKKKFLAFKVNRKGEKGTVIEEFDLDAGKIIMAPPLMGG